MYVLSSTEELCIEKEHMWLVPNQWGRNCHNRTMCTSTRTSLIIHKEDLWIDNDTRTDFTCLRIKDIQGQQLLISIYLTYRFKNIGSTTTGPITWMLDRIHLLRLIQFFGNFNDFSKLQVECRSTYLVS